MARYRFETKASFDCMPVSNCADKICIKYGKKFV